MKNSLWISLLVALALLTGCSPRKSPKYYPIGTDREEVYKRLGPPDNDDSAIVAIWNIPPRKVVSWRDDYDPYIAAYIAVFENDKTITPFLFVKELGLTLTPKMTDTQFLVKVKVFRGLDWESHSEW